MHRYLGLVALAALGALGCERQAPSAQLATEALLDVTEASLTPSLDVAARRFGRAVAMSDDGSIVVVGAPEDATVVPSGGAAHVFSRTGATWTERALLRPAVPADSDAFGAHVAVSGDGTRVAVGAPGAGASDSGAVFVFVVGGSGAWAPEAVLVPSDAEAGDEMSPVALDASGSSLLVGIPGDSTPTCASCGTSVFFTRSGSTWTEGTRLVSPTPAPFERFGHAVDLASDGSSAIVGVPREDTFFVDVGGARIYARVGPGWIHEALLSHGDAVGGDLCGLSVALAASGGRAIVGCPLDDTGAGMNAGTARVFARGAAGAWAEEATLASSPGAERDQVGLAVDLRADGTRAAVGAPADPAEGVAEGVVRVYDLVGGAWGAADVLSPAALALGDAFGRGVALSADGTRIAVGADAADTLAGADSGAAWAFTLHLRRGAPCGSAAVCGTGACVDGVCCESACGGRADDCMACDAASTGGADGTCAALSAAMAARVTCRSAADLCDRAETCSPASTSCPADGIATAGTFCRVAASACDVAESCDGATVACPADLWARAGTECRPVAGVCDVQETCDGSGPDCPTDGFLAAGLECRSSRGVCDVAEVCSGAEALCPRDRFVPEGASCANPDRCDGEELCMGGECRSAPALDCDDGNACTADACDADTGCSHAPIDRCCLADVDCIDADSCTDDRCSPTRECTHTVIAECVPSDAGPVSRDAGSGDAGSSDAGNGADAPMGTAPDAGSGPAANGCGCRATGSGARAPCAILAVLALGAWGRARRRPSGARRRSTR